MQVELAVTNRTEDLLRRDADLAVRMVEPTQGGLVRRRAGRIEVGLFATALYLEAHPPPGELAQLLAGHALIGSDRSRSTIDALAHAGLPLMGQRQVRDYALREEDRKTLTWLGYAAAQTPTAS